MFLLVNPCAKSEIRKLSKLSKLIKLYTPLNRQKVSDPFVAQNIQAKFGEDPSR